MITIWNRKKDYLKQEVYNDGKNRKAPCMGEDVVLLIDLFFWPFSLHSKYYGVQLVPPNFSSSFCFTASVNGRLQFTWQKLFGITFRYDFFGTTFFGMSFWSVFLSHTFILNSRRLRCKSNSRSPSLSLSFYLLLNRGLVRVRLPNCSWFARDVTKNQTK